VSSRRGTFILAVAVAVVTLALSTPVTAAAQTVLLSENFDTGVPATWTQFTGSSTAQNGALALSFGCLVIPGDFDRSAGLRVDADVDITWRAAGDFNYFIFFDPFNPPAPHCYYPTSNGYDFAVYPAGSDNTYDAIRSTVNGNGMNLATTPTALQANTWHHVTAELLPDGTLRQYLDGQLRLSAANDDLVRGPLVLRAWGTVLIDNLQVTSLCSLGPEDQPAVFTRRSGKPSWDEREWSSCGGPATASISSDHVASALVYLNGDLIAGPSDFSDQSKTIEVPVNLLKGDNSLDVELRGAPGGTLSVQFLDR
jgi:hypothetical protein